MRQPNVGRDDHIQPRPFYDRHVAEYLRIGEVASAVGVSVDTLRRWEANGTVQFERRGNQRVLRADKLSALTASVSGADKTSSARNRFHGVVVGITRDRVMAQ